MTRTNIHAIHQFVKNNDTINHYYFASNWNNHKEGSYYHKEPNKRNGSVIGTFIYSNACMQLNLYVFGKKHIKYEHTRFLRSYHHKDIGTIKYWVYIDLYGIKISIYDPFGLETISFQPEKGDLNNTDTIVNQYIEKKILFAPGIFRDLQLTIQKSKTETINHYKNFYCIKNLKDFEWDEIESALLKRLRKRYNIILINSYNIYNDYIVSIKEYGKQKSLTTIDARYFHLTYSDIENYCFENGYEVDENTIQMAVHEIIES